MVKGFCGIEYTSDGIEKGRFVDRALEQDYLQARYDILRRRTSLNSVQESIWRKNGVEARKVFLTMLESANSEQPFFDEEDEETEDDYSSLEFFVYSGEGEVPSGVRSATTGDGVESIPESAFKDQKELRNISFGTVKDIGKSAFANCTSLSNLNLNGVESIGDEAFANCTGARTISFGLLNHIGMGAFRNCVELGMVKIPSSADFIGDYAFAGCSKLNSVIIEPGVSTIPAYCFLDCVGLRSIILPSSIEKVGANAFKNCPNLEVEVPTMDMREAESLLGVKMVARAEDDDSVFKCDQGYVVKLYKDLF